MAGAVHALRDLGEARLQAVEVHERAEQCRDLDVRLLDEDANEGLERRDRGRVVVGGGEVVLRGRRGGRGEVRGCWAALDDLDCFSGEIGCERGNNAKCALASNPSFHRAAGQRRVPTMSDVTGERTSSSRVGSCMNLGSKLAGCRRLSLADG